MTPQISTTLIILVIAVFLFVTERLRVDLVALIVLVALALTGVVTPAEALSGFSNPAVVTVWAVFILSGGLARVGVANIIGRYVLRLAGPSEVRLIALIMLTTGVLSGFMNSIGVAALLLPVLMDIARRTDRPPSKLLMPLAFGSLLGGLVTLIGTPPNILISNALRENGLRPFEMFDFTPVGIAVVLAGVVFMVLVGRHLLPSRNIAKETAAHGSVDLEKAYDLHDQLSILHLPESSSLAGKTLAESRLGSILGLNVIGFIRDGQTRLVPSPGEVLRRDDRLLVTGSLDQITELRTHQHLVLEDQTLSLEDLISAEVGLAELQMSPGSPLLGQTLLQLDFRRQYGVVVIAIKRGKIPIVAGFDDQPLQSGDILLVQGTPSRIETLRASPDFTTPDVDGPEDYPIDDRLMMLHVPTESNLVGKTLAESNLAKAFGLAVLGVVRHGVTQLMPPAEYELQVEDTLLVKGKVESLHLLRSIQDLEIDREDIPDLDDLESDQIGLVEAVLSPHTTLTGKTLDQLHFRAKYGLSVLAIWREGRAFRSNLRDMALRFGDALLLYGSRDKLRLLASEPDFLVLAEESQEKPKLKKAPLALLVMAAVLVPVILGWLPISIAAVLGATLMVLTGSLDMEEAYRFIEWKAVFLIAGMLPLGIAMEKSGAARFLANGVVNIVGGSGPLAVLAALFILSTLASQVMPNPAVAVLLAPIALNTASDLGISPYPLMMVVAVSASAAFMSPVAHPANVLILGPGGYRFSDYIRVGLPLTLVVMAVTLLVLPVFWPF